MLAEWSDDARQDLDDLVHYISRDSVFYAETFAERIVLATRKLGDFPRIGRQIPEAEQDAFREIIVQGYRVMYHLEPDRTAAVTFETLTISRGRMNSPDQGDGKFR